MRRFMVGSVIGGSLLLLQTSAVLAASTSAGARLQVVSAWCLEWGAWIILIGFLSTVAWFALNSIVGGLQRLIAIPVLLIIVGALMEAGPLILPAPAGAEITQEQRLHEVPQP